MYAAGFHELASERNLIYSERRGLFTEALLEGLTGGAARRDPVTRQAEVTSDRLVAYVRDRLDQLTRQSPARPACTARRGLAMYAPAAASYLVTSSTGTRPRSPTSKPFS